MRNRLLACVKRQPGLTAVIRAGGDLDSLAVQGVQRVGPLGHTVGLLGLDTLSASSAGTGIGSRLPVGTEVVGIAGDGLATGSGEVARGSHCNTKVQMTVAVRGSNSLQREKNVKQSKQQKTSLSCISVAHAQQCTHAVVLATYGTVQQRWHRAPWSTGPGGT